MSVMTLTDSFLQYAKVKRCQRIRFGRQLTHFGMLNQASKAPKSRIQVLANRRTVVATHAIEHSRRNQIQVDE